jgi:Phage minor structural protein GP20
MSHTTVETETASGDPIGYYNGRPIYEEGGRLVAGPTGDAPPAGTAGASGDGSSQEDQSSSDPGQGTGGTATPPAPTGSTEGSAQASNVDETSADASGGQQTSDLTNLKKALATERQQRKQAEKDLKDARLAHASAEERQLAAAKDQAAKDAEDRVRPPLIKALAAARLQAAGVQGPTGKLVGLLDMTKVEIDDDGDVVGLEEQVEALKTEFPNLFAVPAAGRPPAPNANGGAGARSGRQGDNGAPPAPKPWNQQLADIVLTGQPGPGYAGR